MLKCVATLFTWCQFASECTGGNSERLSGTSLNSFHQKTRAVWINGGAGTCGRDSVGPFTSSPTLALSHRAPEECQERRKLVLWQSTWMRTRPEATGACKQVWPRLRNNQNHNLLFFYYYETWTQTDEVQERLNDICTELLLGDGQQEPASVQNMKTHTQNQVISDVSDLRLQITNILTID